MITTQEQPLLTKIGKVFLTLGLVIGAILLTLSITQIFSDPKNGLQFTVPIAEKILFWGAWSIACYLLEMRLSCGTWCLRNPATATKPRLKMSKKTTLYFTVLIILSIALFSLFSVKNFLWPALWYSHDFFVIEMMLLFAMFIAMLLYYFSFMEDKREFEKSQAKAGSGDTVVEPIHEETTHSSEPRFWEVFIGLLKNPYATMARLREIPLQSSLVYFLVMVGLIFLPYGILIFPTASSKPSEALVFLISYCAVLGGWIVFGILVDLIINIFGNQTSFIQTLKTLFYAITPLAVFGWIPLLGNIAPFWAVYLVYCGLRERQGIPEQTSLIAVVASTLVIVVLFFVLLYLVLMGAFMGQGIFSKR